MNNKIKRPTKDAFIGIRVTQEIKTKAIRMAKKEKVSLSNYIAEVLRQATDG